MSGNGIGGALNAIHHQGWRPTSVVTQPARIAIRPDGPIHRAKRRNGREWYSRSPRRSHRASTPSSSINMPSPAIRRNDQNTTVEFGRSSGANSFNAGTCLSRLWVRIRLPRPVSQARSGALLVHIGPAKQQQRRWLTRRIFPVPLNGGDFRRLVLQGIQAMHIADQRLDGGDQQRHP